MSGPGSADAGRAATATPRVFQAALERARILSGAPGGEAAIVVRGRLVWAGRSGLAVVVRHQRIGQRTLFSLASVTKTYTAALTLRLVDEGRLRLTDTVGRWLGKSVVRGVRSTTVRALLQQTSGLPDYVFDPKLAHALDDPNHVWTQAELLAAVKDPKGAGRYAYSNTNYTLLGVIDARAGGASIGALFRRLLFEPLGLRNTYVDGDKAPRLIAHGYDVGVGRPVDTFAQARTIPTSIWGPLFTDGGIASTAVDVARFENALYLGHLLRPETLAAMIRPGPDGSYGMGTFTERFAGIEIDGHDGAYSGFTSDAFTDIRRGVTIVSLSNGMPAVSNDYPADDIWNAVAHAYGRGL